MRNCPQKASKAAQGAIKRKKSCGGQTLVEIALVSMTFFLASFALIDFSWLMFNQMNMQDAVREAGRYAATGNSSGGPYPGRLDHSSSGSECQQSECPKLRRLDL